MVKKTFKVIVPGGEATGGPPIGPLLGPTGVNVPAVVDRINELTADLKGVKVPVEITVDLDTKEFDVKVGPLTTTALIVRELRIEKGARAPGEERVGDLRFEQVVKIAKAKLPYLPTDSLKSAVKQILGSCLSMGVTVEGKDPRVVQREVDEGVYDEYFVEGG